MGVGYIHVYVYIALYCYSDIVGVQLMTRKKGRKKGERVGNDNT